MIVDLVSGQQGQQESEVTALVVEEKVKALKAINVRKQEIRSYEVSLWTLQDEFITVLKWSNAEHKGRVEKPVLTLNIDGTEKFECSIPMYIYHEGKRIENPNWYNTRNGALITDLRKLKVILNKATSDEAVFEFVIVQIEETHENEVLTCNITAEGLAFHELGKVGYKISLSQDMFLDDYYNWTLSKSGTEPVCNIQYWLTKMDLNNHFESASKWYYGIEMDWSSFEKGAQRDQHKIYEERFVSSWVWNNQNHTKLIPGSIEDLKEKERPIEVSTSNLYNITQTLAETFGVFCRYEYGHDNNYHINSRKIVFYNNFLQEEDQTFSLIYPYSSSAVSRQMDSTSLTTKLFVLDVDNDQAAEGYNTIMNSGANFTKEDYILNFDYLYQTRGITQEQYDAISKYEKDIREINDALIPIMNEINEYEIKKVKTEAQKIFYSNAKDLAEEQLGQNEEYIKALDIKDGTADGMVEVTDANPEYSKIIVDKENGNYISLAFSNKGIQTDTLHIYRAYDFTNHTPDVGSEVTIDEVSFELDEYGFPTKILGIDPITDNNGNIINDSVYLTYSYRPRSYFEAIQKMWEKQLYENSVNYNEQDTLLDEINEYLEQKKVLKEQNLQNKKRLIHEFEQLMGPALREGYWQPEDYTDYGTKKNSSLSIPAIYENPTNEECTFIWDTREPQDGEDNIYYRCGLGANDIVYYPCVDLTNIYNNIADHIMDYSFIFNNNYIDSNADTTSITNICNFKVGSQAILAFVKQDNNTTIRPILILVGAQTMSDTDDPINHVVNEIAFMKDVNKGNPRLGIITTTYDDEEKKIITEIDDNSIQTVTWLDTEHNSYQIVYPRIKFNTLDLKTNTTDLTIHYGDELIEQYQDYYITTRTDNGNLNYLVTIKPQTLIKSGAWSGRNLIVDYALSNANTSIYLDALKISKENAWPKVSYEVTPNILNHDLIRILYKKLAHLVMINDTDLKFHNVFGYISEVKLDLDDVTNDSIEVKNYKNKFEDLFSSIIAETEAMKQSGNAFNAALAGDVPLSSDGLDSLLQSTNTMNILNAYLDSYFDTSEVVKDRLASLFTEAGEILSSANQSLNKIQGLTLENSSILSGFVQNVAEELSPKVYKSVEKPLGFKIGDIWIQIDPDDPSKEIGRYIATSNYGDLSGNSDNLTAGFVRTYDGTLASITGAALDVNAEEGTIDIKAGNKINIESGKNIYIAANGKVDIVGNESVNIGGTQINIGSTTVLDANNQPETIYGGINLVAAKYSSVENSINNNLSKVLISPQKIEMGSAELKMKSSSTITMIASTGSVSGTTAIKLDANQGIWVGSGKSVTLYSGEAGTGATVQLTHENLILGFANLQSNDATAIELTEKQIILASGGSLSHDEWEKSHVYYQKDIVKYNNEYYKCITQHTSGQTWEPNAAKWEVYGITGAADGLVGARLTKESIGFATQTGTGNNIMYNAVIMNNKGITLGSSKGNIDLATSSSQELKAYFDDIDNGSYVRIADDGIELGSLADLYINTDNFKLQTHSRDKGNVGFEDGDTILAVGSSLQTIGYETIVENGKFYNGNTEIKDENNNSPQVKFLLNKNGAYFNGTIYAAAGSFTGDVTAKRLNAIGALNNQGYGPVFSVDGAYLGVFKLDETSDSLPASLIDVNDAHKLLWFNAGTGDLYIKGTLYTGNMYIDENNTRQTWDAYWGSKSLSYMTEVWNTIKGLFDEAGAILSDAGSALNYTHGLTTENATLLASFATEAQKLNPTVFTSASVPTTFKPGDIWEPASGTYQGNKYIAVSFSSKSSQGSGENSSTHKYSNPLGGWNRVANGSLASITGAGMNIDTDAGTLDLYAGSKISLRAKSQLDLAAGDIQITGNNSINIGSKWINIGSSNGGINIVSTNINANSTTGLDGKINTNGVISKILMDRNGIVMHSNKIDLMAGDNDSVAALQLDPTTGIFIGSSKVLRFFSGTIETGASIELTPTKIHLGVDKATNTTASAAVLTATQILLAVGTTVNSNSTTKITTTTNISGVQIQKDYIGMATGVAESGTSSYRSLISIKPTGILIGVAKGTSVTESVFGTGTANSGSYIQILNESVPSFTIGSTGVFKVLTPTLMIDNSATGPNKMLLLQKATGSGINTEYSEVLSFSQTNGLYIKGAINAISLNVGETGSYSMTYSDSVLQIGDSSTYLKYSSNGLEIKGTISASTGSIGGWIIKSHFIGSTIRKDTSGEDYGGTLAKHYKIGMASSGNYAFWAGLPDDPNGGTAISDISSAKFYVTKDGQLNTSSLIVGSASTMKYDSNGLNIGNGKLTFDGSDLVIQGDVYADNLYLKQSNEYKPALDRNGNILSSMIVLDDNTTKLSEIKVSNGTIDLSSGIFQGSNLSEISQIQMDGSVIKLTSLQKGTTIDNLTNITMDGTSISLSALSTSTDNRNVYNGSKFTMTSNGIKFTASGAFIVEAGNFQLDADGNCTIGNATNYLKYTATGQNVGLEVKGNITATSLIVGTGYKILSYINNELKVGQWKIDENGYLVGGGNGLTLKPDYARIEFGKNTHPIVLDQATTTIKPTISLNLGGNVYLALNSSQNILLNKIFYIHTISTTTIDNSTYVSSISYYDETGSHTVNFKQATSTSHSISGNTTNTTSIGNVTCGSASATINLSMSHNSNNATSTISAKFNDSTTIASVSLGTDSDLYNAGKAYQYSDTTSHLYIENGGNNNIKISIPNASGNKTEVATLDITVSGTVTIRRNGDEVISVSG